MPDPSPGPDYPRRQLLLLAVAGEGAVAGLGLLLLWWRTGSVAVSWGPPAASFAAGGAAAAVFAVALDVVLRSALDIWPFGALRKTYRDVLRPIFRGIGAVDLLVISVAAGFAEELLFRGAIQPVLGLVATSVIFGLVHVFGRDSIPLGLWAACAGLAFGWLMTLTGGLTAPVVAHVVYDALALARIRWGPE